MPEIYPFHGWRYNPEKVSDLSRVLAPPYDVISPQEQQNLYQSSPYNFVRLILNHNQGDERYHDAARALREWTANEGIVRDREPGLYLMDQKFEVRGESVTRSGIIGALELEELGENILPHEQTIDKHIKDRYRLMEETGTNLGQIFMSFRDESMAVESIAKKRREAPPLLDVDIPGHARYRLWNITSESDIRNIRQTLASTTAIIADGHHRYKTALQFAGDHPEVPGSDRVMVSLINAYNPGMLVLPTHRLVSNVQIEPDRLRSELGKYFHLEETGSPGETINRLRANHEAEGIHLGFYHKPSEMSLMLTFRREELLETEFPGASTEYRTLDVTILHHFLLKQLLNLDTENQEDLERVKYIRGNVPVTKMLQQERDYDVACFVNPPDFDTIFSIAESGRTLPQKTTYFFPKIYSGLVFRRLE